MKDQEVKDLFSLDRMLTPAERRRLQVRTNPKKSGHAAPPGTGPEGETCKTCANLTRIRLAKTYLKCLLREGTWTGGYGTDIRARDPSCHKWEAKSANRPKDRA